MPQPADLHRRLAAAIERVSTALRQGVQGAASEEGLSPLQLRALQILSRRPGLRLGELARELHVTPGTLSAAVTTLESKGLARKESDPSEHRAVHLHATRSGKAAARRSEVWPDETLLPAIEELGAQEAGAVLAGVLRLIQSLESTGVVRETRMCLQCDHFEAWAGSGDRPHRCGLLEAAIGGPDLRVDCEDFEATSPEERVHRLQLLKQPD